MSGIFFLGAKTRERYLKVLSPAVGLFARAGVHPHVLTVGGFVISLLAAILYAKGVFFWAACSLLLSGICDTLDGQIARMTNKQSRFGAFFDSTLDRYSDLFPFAGLAYFFSGGAETAASARGVSPSPLTIIAIVLTIAGSFMVSYTRARAEGLGVECKNGIMQRPERITILIIGSLLGAIPVIGHILIKATLVVLAVMTNATALSRMVHAGKKLASGRGPS